MCESKKNLLSQGLKGDVIKITSLLLEGTMRRRLWDLVHHG